MAAPQALIKDLEGEVSVTRNGEVVAVKAGDFLLPGDEVVTGGTGRLSLEFPGTEGQIPAAGVMTANGKLTLGEQPGPNGQQIVVLEDGECFEFTTELAENSAAAEGGAVAGLFGAGLLGAGSGGIAGAGAVAAGAFLAGGGSDDSSSAGSTSGSGTGTNIADSSGGLGGVGAGEFSSEDSPQSLEEFAGENLTQENLQESILEPIQTAVENSQANPESTPDNIAVAAEDTGMGVLENVHDALVATTGEGTPQADLIQQLVDGVNQTPLGEPLSPITTPLVDAVNTDLGLDTLIAALPNIDPTDGGLVTSVVDTVDGITQPLSQEIEPVDMLMGELHDAAVEIDNLLEGAVEGILGGADTLESALQGAGGTGGLPEIPEGDLLGTLSTGISSGADVLGDQLGGSGLPTDGLPG
jgi:hypothetical protein